MIAVSKRTYRGRMTATITIDTFIRVLVKVGVNIYKS